MILSKSAKNISSSKNMIKISRRAYTEAKCEVCIYPVLGFGGNWFQSRSPNPSTFRKVPHNVRHAIVHNWTVDILRSFIFSGVLQLVFKAPKRKTQQRKYKKTPMLQKSSNMKLSTNTKIRTSTIGRWLCHSRSALIHPPLSP